MWASITSVMACEREYSGVHSAGTVPSAHNRVCLIRSYFAKHKWGNATLDDFLSAIQDNAPSLRIDLKVRRQALVETRGRHGSRRLHAGLEQVMAGDRWLEHRASGVRG